MAKQFYKHFDFKPDTLDTVDEINKIVAEYQAQGFVLTVRQLYYQLVARGQIPNTVRSYKRITGITNDARLMGLIDWDAIEDRTREFLDRSHWGSGTEILEAIADQFYMDHWEDQSFRVFVIVEKEALAGVLQAVCREYDMPLLAARGYPSCTVLRDFARSRMMLQTLAAGQTPVLLHLGDHDPSGIDMSRDLTERVALFAECSERKFEFHRIALNMAQVEAEQPPPNPAKSTDSRFADYVRQFGDESWELDALSPKYLTDLVRRHVRKYIDKNVWKARDAEIADIRERLTETAENF